MKKIDTYKMTFTCRNCSTEFESDIEKGLEAKYFGECPYCGQKGWFAFTSRKPQQTIAGMISEAKNRYGFC